MLKVLRRWLGWDEGSDPFDFGELKIPERPRTAAATHPAPGAKPAGAAAAAAGRSKVTAATAAGQPKKERDLLEVLDNPKLSLERPTAPEDGFDPYNTGAFNRSASWERISRKKR
jgi:hypothetical protein